VEGVGIITFFSESPSLGFVLQIAFI